MKSLFTSLLLALSATIYSQTIWQVCVAEPDAGTCGLGQVGVFTPGNLVIQQGDMIQFTTHMVALTGYPGTSHDIQFTGSPANNVTLPVSSNILSQVTTVTTPPFNTPGIFPMECVDGNHCLIADLLSGYLCGGYTVEVQSSCTLTADFTTTSLNYCTGDVINFTNTSSGATSYTWKLDEFVFSTSTDAVLSFGGPGSHDIELIADDGAGCLDSTTITINIDQAVDAGGDDDAIFCNVNDSIDLNSLVTGSSGGTWFEATSSGQFNSSTGVFNYSGLSPNTYSFNYFLTGTGACPNDTANFLITVNQEPDLNLMLGSTTIAMSDSLYINFTTSGILGTASFLWNFCDGNLATDMSPFYYQWNTAGNQCVCVQVNNGNNCVETFCDSTIFIIDDLGIITDEFVFDIFPNPADEQLKIKFASPQTATLNIWDAANRLVKNISIQDKTLIELDVASLPKGIYWFQFIKDENTSIRRVIIQ